MPCLAWLLSYFIGCISLLTSCLLQAVGMGDLPWITLAWRIAGLELTRRSSKLLITRTSPYNSQSTTGSGNHVSLSAVQCPLSHSRSLPTAYLAVVTPSDRQDVQTAELAPGEGKPVRLDLRPRAKIIMSGALSHPHQTASIICHNGFGCVCCFHALWPHHRVLTCAVNWHLHLQHRRAEICQRISYQCLMFQSMLQLPMFELLSIDDELCVSSIMCSMRTTIVLSDDLVRPH